jgi:hypothetical protein
MKNLYKQEDKVEVIDLANEKPQTLPYNAVSV